MVLIILATILILVIAFFQVLQGLFSALIMTLLTILSASVAFSVYQPLGELLYSTEYGAYADATALITSLVVTLLILRILFDKFIIGNVVMGVWANRIGGGILGIITGMILVGTLAVGIQMIPFDATILTYKPFDDSLQRNQSLSPFLPDQFTVGFVKTLLNSSLKGEGRFIKEHDDLLLEAFCERNTALKFGRRDALPDAMKNILVFKAPERRLAPWRDDIPDNPLLDPTEPTRDLVVRVEIDESAGDIGGNKEATYRLPATHFRMVSKSGRSYYPVAYLTYGRGGWEAHGAPVEDNRTQIARLIVARPLSNQLRKLTVDWVFRIPNNEQEDPEYIVFRRVSKSDIIRKIAQQMPRATNALRRVLDG